MKLRPFFSYYGAKHRLAASYSAPTHDRIIECFAGSAAYASLHHAREVLLVDLDPVICAVWDYLIHVSEAELLSLPVGFDSVNELSVCQEAKWFLGFWLRRLQTHPGITLSAWGRQERETGKDRGNFWGERVRAVIAGQLQHIRHWQVLNASYLDIPEQRATYFVDPPYQVKGYLYRCSKIDFPRLGEWCQTRAAAGNQIIACEAEGADWLPFRQFRRQTTVTPKRKAAYSEVVWESA